MPILRPLFAAAAVAALSVPGLASAHAALGLGADWIADPHDGELQLTLAVDTPLARHISLGARFGAMYLPEPDRVGVPLDGRLRIRAGRVYADGLVGPWFVFDDPDSVRFHAAFGFGLLTRTLSFGFEVGALGDSAIIGVRVAFPL